MNYAVELRRRRAALLLLAATLALATASAKDVGRIENPQEEPVDRSGGAAQLPADVAEIANLTTLSRAKKEKLISTAVREAVLTSTGHVKDPNEILKIASDLTAAATQAAPHFEDVIARAALFAGRVAGIEGAAGRIRTAAFAPAKHPGASRMAKNVNEPAEADAIGEDRRVARHGARETDSNGPVSSGSDASRIQFGDNSNVTLTAAVGVSHDSNIFLKNKDEVAETTTSLTPGAEFKFGHHSLAHGHVGYKVAFNRYVNKSAPNSSLGTGSADFGYGDDHVTINATAFHQQVQANTTEVSAMIVGDTIVRRDDFNVDTNGEARLTAKTSLQSGLAINWTKYKQPGVIGSKNITLPLKVYVETTPKLALSAGASYTQVTPQGGGSKGRDLFYNIGLRGNLTGKLTSNFSVGYRTRTVANNPTESFWGFDGGFNYEATSKTNLSLVLSRNFSTGASGESIKSSSYFLNFSTVPTVHWQFDGAIGYRAIDYGPNVFANKSTLFSSGREDRPWESSLNASYVFTNWFRATAAWTHRLNHSNQPLAEYSDTILSLMLVFQY